MNIRRALTFPFQDPRWVGKLGIAMVLTLVPAALVGYRLIAGPPSAVPVLGGASTATLQATAFSLLWTAFVGLLSVPLSGYLLRITRNVVAGHDVPLPEWSDVGDFLRDGLKLWVVITLWTLPEGLARLAVSPFAGNGSGGGWPAINTAISVVFLAVIVVLPAAQARLAVTGSLAAGLDVPAAFATARRNLGGYLGLLLVVGVGFAVVAGLGTGLVVLVWRALGGTPSLREIVAVGITVALVLLWSYGLFPLNHLYGQVYARAQDGVSAASPRSHLLPADA